MMSYSTLLVQASVMVLPTLIMATTTTQDTSLSHTQNKFSFYLQDDRDQSTSLSTNSSVPNISVNASSTASANCSCTSNETDTFLANAHMMMDQMMNKTTMLSKIRHRATHSNQAVWASFTLSGLMVLLVVGVLQSKMWNDRTFISYPDSQPVKFEQYNPKSEILVKDLIRSRGRNLVTLFSRRRKKTSSKNTLKMETFLSRQGDTVDSSHKALLESSDEEFYMESDSESEEETVFKINSRTGQWEGLEKGDTEEMSMSLLGGRKRSRVSTSSTESRFSNSMINSSVAKDLLRLSDSEVEGEEEKQLIKVG